MSEQKPTPETVKEDKDSEPAKTGGPKGSEPTRYGDWERGGKCIDF